MSKPLTFPGCHTSSFVSNIKLSLKTLENLQVEDTLNGFARPERQTYVACDISMGDQMEYHKEARECQLAVKVVTLADL